MANNSIWSDIKNRIRTSLTGIHVDIENIINEHPINLLRTVILLMDESSLLLDLECPGNNNLSKILNVASKHLWFDVIAKLMPYKGDFKIKIAPRDLKNHVITVLADRRGDKNELVDLISVLVGDLDANDFTDAEACKDLNQILIKLLEVSIDDEQKIRAMIMGIESKISHLDQLKTILFDKDNTLLLIAIQNKSFKIATYLFARCLEAGQLRETDPANRETNKKIVSVLVNTLEREPKDSDVGSYFAHFLANMIEFTNQEVLTYKYAAGETSKILKIACEKTWYGAVRTIVHLPDARSMLINNEMLNEKVCLTAMQQGWYDVSVRLAQLKQSQVSPPIIFSTASEVSRENVMNSNTPVAANLPRAIFVNA